MLILLAWSGSGLLCGYAAARYRGFPPLGSALVGAIIGPFASLLFLRSQNSPVQASVVPEHRQSNPPALAPTSFRPHGFLAVVGESQYQGTLRALRRELREEGADADALFFTATLKPEPDNPVDPNAIAVLSPDGAPLGYLAERVAKQYHRKLAVLGTLDCEAEIRGGTRKKRSIGVVLTFDDARDKLKAITLPAEPRKPRANRVTSGASRLATSNNPLQSGVVMGDLDAHGQPLNLSFNAHRRAERDISELLGIMKGLLADGVVDDNEAGFLRKWIEGHQEAASRWPVSAICHRLEAVFADGRIDDPERNDLKTLLETIVGGKITMELQGENGAAIPFDDPLPLLVWPGMAFVFTGQFAYGTRRCCEQEVERRGGVCQPNVTLNTRYLVIGTFGSRDWTHSSFGRKIQKAIDYRERGRSVSLIGEDHWAQAL